MSEDGVPDYAELSLGRFLDMVASREPSPGGGASASVAVALAAALSSMVARFSTEHLTDAGALAEQSEKLRSEALALARDDAAAYGRVLDANRDSHGVGEKKRWQGVRKALTEAADVPLSVAGIGVEVVGNAARLAEEGNPSLRGDAVAAVALAEAGVRAAAALVEINVMDGAADDGRLSRAADLRATAAAAQEALEGVGARGGG